MISINGERHPASGSVLDCCKRAGAEVDTFCCDDNIGGGGHCRSCLVEIDGRLQASCTTAAKSGMNVRTDTEELRSYRRDLGELMLAESSPDARVRQTLDRWQCRGDRYQPGAGRARADDSHVYLRIDTGKCVSCRLCQVACDRIQGQFVYDFVGRGNDTRLAWSESGLGTSECVSCGLCAQVCPAGAISDRDRQRPESSATRTVTTCAYCGVGCQLVVHSDGGEIHHIDGGDSPVNRGHLCVKGRYAHGFLHHPARLRTPLIRRNGQLQSCTWDEALAAVADAFNRHRGRAAALSSSRCTNEENYLVQKWMRAGMGTHNVDCCARVCHAPTATGMRRSFGTGAATNSLADIELADVIMVAGCNPTEAHPVTGARIKGRVLSRGARLVVIDPRATELARLADVHLQLRPGTNVALLNSIAAVLVEEELIDRAFIDRRTTGLDSFAEFIADYTPESTERITGVPAPLVRRAARLYGGADRPLQVHGLGMTEHYQGSEGVMLLCTLAMLVGGIGRRGVGVNPLRGQNNVQGAADMGCQPDAMTGYADPGDPEARARFEAVWGRPVPIDPGLTLPGMYRAATEGRVRALYILGEDVVQSDPSVHVEPALDSLDFLVVQELFLSATAERADVVLPGASFFEKDGTFTNGERRIQRVRKVVDPVDGCRPDWVILQELMNRCGLPQSFESPAEIMDEIARVAPAFAGVSYPALDAAGAGLQWPVPSAGHPGTEILHVDSFPLGHAELARIPYLDSPAIESLESYPLRLITGRVLEHYNCGSMTRRTENTRLVDEDILELCPSDAVDRGVADGERVVVSSPTGAIETTARHSARIAPGTAFISFHFTETKTNCLTLDVLDRLADCPEYKFIPVEVRPLRQESP